MRVGDRDVADFIFMCLSDKSGQRYNKPCEGYQLPL